MKRRQSSNILRINHPLGGKGGQKGKEVFWGREAKLKGVANRYLIWSKI